MHDAVREMRKKIHRKIERITKCEMGETIGQEVHITIEIDAKSEVGEGSRK